MYDFIAFKTFSISKTLIASQTKYFQHF